MRQDAAHVFTHFHLCQGYEGSYSSRDRDPRATLEDSANRGGGASPADSLTNAGAGAGPHDPVDQGQNPIGCALFASTTCIV